MKYAVQIPITGSLYYEVEADSRDTAFEVAWSRLGEGYHGDEPPTWEACEAVAEGNVSHAELNRQCATPMHERASKNKS